MPEWQSKPLLLLDSPASVIRQAMADQPGSALQDLHPGLGAEHPLLIGSQDQGLCPGQEVRLGADVPFSIEEQHPQQLACGIQEMHRDDADRAVPLCCWASWLEGEGDGSGGHGWTGERLRRDAPV